jgi:hypothetical protein
MKFYARYRDSTVQVSLFEKNSSCEEVNWFYLYDGNIPPSPDWQLVQKYEWGQKLFQRK